MFIKCSYCDGVDNVVINLPETEKFEIRCKYDDGLYLILPDEEIILRDIYHWCDGRPELPTYAVDELYSEIVDVIAKTLISDENIRSIDIDEIENKLLDEKYAKKWSSNGYITIDENGVW